MALVCTTCHFAGHVRSRMNDSKLSSACSGASSRCHLIVLRSPNLSSVAVSGVNLGRPKATPVSDRFGAALKRNREGPQRHGQWRAALSNSADKPSGMNGEGTGNGGIRAVAFTHVEKVGSGTDNGSEGNLPATRADGRNGIQSRDNSSKRSANTDTWDRIAMSSESGATNPYELSDFSVAPKSRRNGNFQENFLDRDKGISEAEEEEYVSLVWEAGSEIEKVTPETGSLEDRNDTEENTFTSTIEKERLGKEEPLLCIEISREVANAGAQMLNMQRATERLIWIPREENAFYEFFGNLSKMQQKIWLMVVVHGKLAWIRLQQLLARKLRTLEGILANFPESENDLNAREVELLAFADKLMNKSAQHEEAYRRSQEALRVAEGMVVQLDTRARQLIEDVASRDALLRLLQKDASVSSESLQRGAQSLSDAERRIIYLEKRVQTGEESLWAERDKLTAAEKSADSLEEAARVAENKVVELTAEISSLKALAAAGRRAEYLSRQVNALEQELKSRDAFLLEINGESKRSKEALTVAAQIKQDLNTARQREVQLAQKLEGANNKVKELQTELSDNLRSLRAEQALRQTETMLRDANSEVQRLRRGVEERDKSIHLMKDEVDLNIGLLNNAARDREELYKMKFQVEDLKGELGSRENKLRIVREEMASVINLAKQKQSTPSGASGSDRTSLLAAESSPAVQASKPKKKKLQSKKQTAPRQSSQSAPP